MSSLTNFQQRCLAFSALCEAASVVDEIANGRTRTSPQHLLEAVFTQNQQDLGEVFKPLSAYRVGMGIAADLLSGKIRSPQQARYVAQLLKLAALLKQDRAMVDRLRTLLDRASAGEPSTTAAADIYKETISKLSQRIQVTGAPEVLQEARSAEQIRAVLLAGIRFAWAWSQLGGRQWHLLLQRSAMKRTLGELSL